MFTEAQRNIARKLRRDATEAEKKLWRHLRNRQFLGLKFKRQWPVGPYVADFACLEMMLIVELDGGQHSPEVDAERSTYLRNKGWRLVRFWNNDVMSNLDGILTSLEQTVRDLKS